MERDLLAPLTRTPPLGRVEAAIRNRNHRGRNAQLLSCPEIDAIQAPGLERAGQDGR
jgi:hypothetical protein